MAEGLSVPVIDDLIAEQTNFTHEKLKLEQRQEVLKAMLMDLTEKLSRHESETLVMEARLQQLENQLAETHKYYNDLVGKASTASGTNLELYQLVEVTEKKEKDLQVMLEEHEQDAETKLKRFGVTAARQAEQVGGLFCLLEAAMGSVDV